MKEVVVVLMALAIFGGAILSLEVRRRHRWVGVATGAFVLVLILLGLGGIALSAFATPKRGDSTDPFSELSPIVAVLVALVGVAGTIGRFQGRPLRMSRGIAGLGGVGQLVPLALVMTLLRPETGFDGPMPFRGIPVGENVWIGLCGACVVAQLLAPVILVGWLRCQARHQALHERSNRHDPS